LKVRIGLTLILLLCYSFNGRAQSERHAIPIHISDSEKKADVVIANKYNDELDLLDVGRNVLHHGVGRRMETGEIRSKKLRISLVPAAGYTLQTGLAALLAGNAAFYVDTSASASTILTSFTYTVKNQILIPIQTSLWTKNNKYNIILDWRYLYFPSYTYGLGGYTSLDDGYLVNYSAIHIHQAVLRKLREHMYIGPGYNLDYYWDIRELNPPANLVTDFENYGSAKTEFASGFTFNFLYDDRDNPINAKKGNFLNVVYRPNLTIFGNTATWRSLVIDVRKYIPFPASSKNVLAFWSYEWLSLSGKPPYMMLPNTGGDPYSNTGRGYIQGRFRGDNMAYLEGEYRFRITNNGLLGGAVFANAESFTEETSKKFETIAPGWGAGIRLKFNKFSRTNVAIDYGFGLGGSGGLFVNVGEVF
jgi:Omp85 superfamily domain